MTDLINARGITKRYDGTAVLDDVSLRVPAGCVTGFIGVNGAGKTTTIRALMGLMEPDAGEVILFGEPFGPSADDATARRLKERIGVVLNTCPFIGDLPVKTAGTLMKASYPSWRQGALRGSAGAVRTRPQEEDQGGSRLRQLCLACALAHDPDLLILDEATAGLDPMARDEILDLLRDFMADESRGILISSHITTDLEKIADRVVCIDQGRIAFDVEKDLITDMAGVAHCRTAEFEDVRASDLFAPRRAALAPPADERRRARPRSLRVRQAVPAYRLRPRHHRRLPAAHLEGRDPMKAAFLCEFATIRSALLQMAIIYLVIGVVVGIAMESSIAMVACISAMTPFLVVFTLSGYDEANGWQRFRACLPISRGAIVFGRYAIVLLSSVVMATFAVVVALVLAQAAPYLPLADGAAESLAAQSDPLMLAASALAGTAIILLVTALIMPFVLRFGMNKAMRIVPVVIVLLFVVAIALVDALAGISWLYGVTQSTPSSPIRRIRSSSAPSSPSPC